MHFMHTCSTLWVLCMLHASIAHIAYAAHVAHNHSQGRICSANMCRQWQCQGAINNTIRDSARVIINVGGAAEGDTLCCFHDSSKGTIKAMLKTLLGLCYRLCWAAFRWYKG